MTEYGFVYRHRFSRLLVIHAEIAAKLYFAFNDRIVSDREKQQN